MFPQAGAQRCSVKKEFLKISQNSQTCNFITKETLAQVFSSEFCEISKNTFSYRTPLVAVSEANNFNKYFSTITLDIHSSIRYIKRLLLSNIDKIPEKIMYNRLYIFLEIIELIQFGFRQKHSTTY